MFEYDKKVADDMGKVNFVVENKMLRDENEKLVRESQEVNAGRNELDKELREVKAEMENLARKVREMTVFEKMRQERF